MMTQISWPMEKTPFECLEAVPFVNRFLEENDKKSAGRDGPTGDMLRTGRAAAHSGERVIFRKGTGWGC